MVEAGNRAKVFLRGALVALVVAGAGIAGVAGVSSIFSSGEDPSPDRQKQQAESPRFDAEDFNGIEPSAKPVRSAWDWTPEPVDASSREVENALARHRSSLLFFWTTFRARLKLEWDPTVIPNGQYCTGSVTWLDVLDEQGRSVLAPSGRGKSSDLPERGFGSNPEILLSSDQAHPRQATGRVKLRVPLTWRHVSLPADEIGRAQADGPLRATLRACQNDCYAVEIEGQEGLGDPVVFARGFRGRRLRSRQSKTSRGSIVSRVQGVVHTVEIYSPVEWHETAAEVVAMGAPEAREYKGDDAATVPNPRYLPELERLYLVSMSRDRLVETTQVEAGRCDALWEYNLPEVRVYLPPVDNSAYATVEFLEPAEGRGMLLDAQGRRVECKTARTSYGDKEGGFGAEIRFEAPEGDEDPVDFARTRGKVRVRYPAEVRKVTLTKAKPESGGIRAEFLGRQVRIDGWDSPGAGSFSDMFHPAMAYDASGRRLAPVHTGSFLGGRCDFWGTPTRLVLLEVTRWIEMEIPFDLAPAELLAKPKSVLGL